MKSTNTSFSIIVIFVLFILCGISLIYFLNFKLDSNYAKSSLTVYFSFPNTEPKVIEKEVTSKLEAIISKVQGIKEIQSLSDNNIGVIWITLDKHYSVDAVRFEISTLIRQIWPQLPKGVSYPQLTVDLANNNEKRPLLSYMLIASADPYIVQQYANNHIKTALSQISGLNKIEIYGATSMGWQILVDDKVSENLDISPFDIQNSITLNLSKNYLGKGLVTNSLNSTNVKSNIPTSLPIVISVSHLNTLNHYNNKDTFKIGNSKIKNSLLHIPIKNSHNRIVFLENLATADYVEEYPQNYYRINGLNTINILLFANIGENNLVLAKKVKETINNLTNKLPKGFKIIKGDDSTEYIYIELNNILKRTLFATGILLLFLLLVTKRWKYAIMVLFVLIGNLCIAIIFYYFFKIELHLYALAGITVSLGLMTDNIIIMFDHIKVQNNRKAILAILAGTLATISSLIVVFFLDEKVKGNLIDFALVIIINQTVSLMTALFVIPALINKIDPFKSSSISVKNNFKRKKNNKRNIIHLNRLYENIYFFFQRYKAITILIYILGFGIPIYVLPEKIEESKWLSKIYNTTCGGDWYKENIKPWLDITLGGSLRLFSEKVIEGSYLNKIEETSLLITASTPKGTTLQQTNIIIKKMEAFLSQYQEVASFISEVSQNKSTIKVYFKKKYRLSDFPFLLKTYVIKKAIDIGGAEWGVIGIGEGFNNSTNENAGSYSIKILGYNYDQLYDLAKELKKNIITNKRIKEVNIVSEISWFKPDNNDYNVKIDNQKAVLGNTTPLKFYASLSTISLSHSSFTSVNTVNGTENIWLKSKQANQTDLWAIVHSPLSNNPVKNKFNTIGNIEKETIAAQIRKINQQYFLYLQFDYYGSDKFAQKFIDKTINKFKTQMPLGYSIENIDIKLYQWDQKDKKQYWILPIIILMIFFICSILFDSIIQPFAVILTIPAGYIGLILTFYLFEINFDQGGFAALILLTGITVNSTIYILNDYNHFTRIYKNKSNKYRLFFKAFNYKIEPIILTVFSCILSLIPFLIGEKQSFWYSLASGTIGGMVFYLIGITIFLPLFLRIKRN